MGRPTLERVDPGGVISSAIEARRVIGSIVYFATEITEPGVVQHTEGNRISRSANPTGRALSASARLPRRSSPPVFVAP
jgi:2-dehydropantoate 2-reductase